MSKITGRSDIPESNRIRTNLYSFDHAFSSKGGEIGLPTRSIVEIAGQKGVGKTTVSLSLSGRVAKQLNRGFSLVDFERQNKETVSDCLKFAGFDGEPNWYTYTDEDYAVKGVRSETILDTATKRVKMENPDVVLVDSLAAFSPTAELEGELGDANMGKQSFIAGQWFRRTLQPLLSNPSPTIVFFTNHQHQTFGGMKTFAPVYHTSGGKTKEYLSTHSITLGLEYNKILIEEGCRLIKGKVGKNRDGYTGKVFYLFVVDGEGISDNLTAMYDCIMSKYAKVSQGVVVMDGIKYQNVRKMIASRFDDNLFAAFHNTLKANDGNFTVSEDVETDDEERKPLDDD